MKAIVIEGKRKLALVERDTPKADGQNVLMKIERVGICGSDIHFWENGDDKDKGLIMGHEFSGVVVDPGSRTDLKAGDRVTALPMNNCQECFYCKNGQFNRCTNVFAASPGISAPGAYAEYFLARTDVVRKLPDNVSLEEAAMLEPAAVSLRAVLEAGVKPGDSVLVSGGGIIGLLAAAWAKYAGATYIAMTEANPLRGENAVTLGDVNEYFDARDEQLIPKLLKASGGGFDVCIDCAGLAASINTGIFALKKGGVLAQVGQNYTPQPVNILIMTIKEIKFLGMFAYVHEFDRALNILAKGGINLKRFISGTVGLDGVQEAFERLSSGKYPDVKILIQP